MQRFRLTFTKSGVRDKRVEGVGGGGGDLDASTVIAVWVQDYITRSVT